MHIINNATQDLDKKNPSSFGLKFCLGEQAIQRFLFSSNLACLSYFSLLALHLEGGSIVVRLRLAKVPSGFGLEKKHS